MKLVSLLAAIHLLMQAPQANAEEQLPPCIPLNETISICTDIDGLDVAFFGATETSVMGIVNLNAIEGTPYGLWVFWHDDASLEKVSGEQTGDFAGDYDQYQLEDPVSVVVEGFPGVRYDLLPVSGSTRELLPKTLVFLDMGAGIAMLHGEARQPDVSVEELFLGASNAARVLKKAE